MLPAPIRIAFDPALPVVVASAFDAGGRRFEADSEFPWRELDITEQVLHDLWRAGVIAFVPAPVAAPLAKLPAKQSQSRR